MKGSVLVFISIVWVNSLVAQSTKLKFAASFNSLNVNLKDTTFISGDSNNFEIRVLKFYVSNIVLLKNEKIVFEEANSFHLIDFSKPKSRIVELNNINTDYNKVRFNLGIDSTTNSLGAMGGGLDPTKGMYWTWQTGYINFKLEGTSKASTSRKNEFVYHLGGYQYPNNAVQALSFPINYKKEIDLELNLNELIAQLNMAEESQVMSPSAYSVQISKLVAKCLKEK